MFLRLLIQVRSSIVILQYAVSSGLERKSEFNRKLNVQKHDNQGPEWNLTRNLKESFVTDNFINE